MKKSNWSPPAGAGRQVFSEGINDDSAGRFTRDLLTWMEGQQKANTLVIYLNSVGGSVRDAIAMRTTIGLVRNAGHNVTIVVTGGALSCAMMLTQAADEVLMNENAWMMIHRVSSHADGGSVDLGAEANFVGLLQEQSFALTATQKWSAKQIAERVSREGTLWLNAKQCFELGLVDCIIAEPAISRRASAARRSRSRAKVS